MDNETKVEIERLHDEDKRQNRRIDQLEENIKVIQELTISVHTLAHDMKQMLDEQRDQICRWHGKPRNRNRAGQITPGSHRLGTAIWRDGLGPLRRDRLAHPPRSIMIPLWDGITAIDRQTMAHSSAIDHRSFRGLVPAVLRHGGISIQYLGPGGR